MIIFGTKTIRMRFWLLTLSLFLPLISFSQNFNQSKLDSLFDYLSQQNEAMGNIAIHQNGKEVYTKAFGYRDIESRTKNTPYTLYRIGSISKTYTATVIMQLIEEKKLNLNSSLSEYFPDIPNADKISIENLLAHQSGLQNFTNDPDYSKWMTEDKSQEELLELFSKLKIDFEPGTASEYSNTNYVLLSFIAEKIEQQSFAAILQQRIFQPLQLKSTRFGGKIKPKNNEAYSYHFSKNWKLSPETNMSIPQGAGAISSSASEVTTFFEGLFSEKLLKPSSLEEMKSERSNYGLGLLKLPYRDKEVYGHAGSIDDFQAISFYLPNEHTGITLLFNALQMDMNEIALGALDIYFGYDYKLPKLEKISNPKQYIGIYTAESFPLELQIFTENGFLYGQATGQPSFRLLQKKKNIFEYKTADLLIEFYPNKEELKLMQMGQTHVLKKQSKRNR